MVNVRPVAKYAEAKFVFIQIEKRLPIGDLFRFIAVAEIPLSNRPKQVIQKLPDRNT